MEKQKRLGLILLGVAVIGWFGVLNRQIGNFADQALKVRVLNEEVTSYTQRLKDINEIKSRGETIIESLKSMYLALPKSSQIPETLVMIESIANSSGVILSSSTVGTPSDSEVPVSLSFGGNIVTVSKFLDALYSNVRTSSIKTQSITTDGSGNLSVSISLGLVYQGGAP